MDVLLTILAPVFWVIKTLFAILLWIAWQVLWIVLWLVLPLAIAAYIAFRVAEKVFGPDATRAWLKRQSLRLGGGVWEKLSRGLIASSVLPFRVMAWFVVYAIWHSLVSLFWRPRWTPWDRAWAKRWKPAGTKVRGRAARAR